MKAWKACLVVPAALALTAPIRADTFTYAPPEAGGQTRKLWSTRYYVHYVDSATGADAAPLYRSNGTPLGVSIPKAQFCFGALQGTVAVRSGNKTYVYNAAGLSRKRAATCAYRKLKPQVNERLGRQAWTEVTGNGRFGLGVQNYRLVPFRTIAVDRTTIPYGTVLFIPALKGVEFDDNGTRRTHDGYVLAGDTGGAIKGNHIDFFTGNFTGPAPSFVTSNDKGLFDATVVTDPAIVSALRKDATYAP